MIEKVFSLHDPNLMLKIKNEIMEMEVGCKARCLEGIFMNPIQDALHYAELILKDKPLLVLELIACGGGVSASYGYRAEASWMTAHIENDTIKCVFGRKNAVRSRRDGFVKLCIPKHRKQNVFLSEKEWVAVSGKLVRMFT